MQVTQSWFVAKAAIALSPIIGFGTVDLIRWLLLRAGWRRKGGQQTGADPAREGEVGWTSRAGTALRAIVTGSRSPNPQRCVRSQNDRLP